MMRKAGVITAIALAVLGGVLLTGCKKQDTEKPTINIVTPNKDNHDVAPGAKLNVKIELSDNVELSSLKLGIHWAGDGHTHEGHHHGALRTRAGETVKLHYHWDCTLSGKSQTVEHAIEVPANTEHGPYHLEVSCVDKAGNEAKAFQDIHVEP